MNRLEMGWERQGVGRSPLRGGSVGSTREEGKVTQGQGKAVYKPNPVISRCLSLYVARAAWGDFALATIRSLNNVCAELMSLSL